MRASGRARIVVGVLALACGRSNQSVVDAGIGVDTGAPLDASGDASAVGACTWTMLDRGFAGPQPAMVWDATGQRLVIVGRDEDSALLLSTTPRRESLATQTTRPRIDFERTAVVLDAARGRALAFGDDSIGQASDLWALTLTSSPAWSAVATTGAVPAARTSAVAALDSAAGRLFVTGGFSGTTILRDSYVLDLTAATPVWSRIDEAAPITETNRPQAASWDAGQSRLLLRLWSGDVWAFGPGTGWTQLNPRSAAPPLGRGGRSMPDLYDPVARALLVVDVLDVLAAASLEELQAVHALELPLDPLGGFKPVAAMNRPPRSSIDGRYPVAYDPKGDRIFVLVNWTYAGRANEIWTLPLAACR
jgi:hypothetical protein